MTTAYLGLSSYVLNIYPYVVNDKYNLLLFVSYTEKTRQDYLLKLVDIFVEQIYENVSDHTTRLLVR